MMKEDLIQALNSYMETVEQKLNSLDKRVAELEQNIHTINQENDNLRGKLQQMETLLVAANQQMVQLQIDNKPSVLPDVKPAEQPEPETETEVIIPEDPIIEDEPMIDEPVIKEPLVEEAPVVEEPIFEAEPAVAEQALSIDDLPEAGELDEAMAMPMDDMPDLVPVTEPVVEPVAESLFEPVQEPVSPMAQPIAEPEVTPIPQEHQPEPVKPEEPAQSAAPRATTLFGSPVSDIRQAISLGDRFLFQRELFDQSGEKMQKTLDAINKCQSYDEAVNMLDASFHWDKETTAYTLFTAALQRRFS